MIYFSVGPSQLYPTVPGHIKNALKENVFSMNHRGKEFGEIFVSINTSLKKLLEIPKDYKIFFLGSATEGMERVIENVVAEKSFHFVNGSFGKRFFTIASDLKKTPEKIEVPFGSSFDFSKIKVPKSTELIAVTQSDTSTGVAIPEKEIANLKKKYPKALIAVDVVSSIPYCDLDYSYMDAVIFSVQKGFGLPAGLGVLVLSPAAMEKSHYLKKKGYSIGSFHSFLELQKYAEKFQTPETPNVFDIYLFEKILQDMLKKGVGRIRKETDEKAKMMYDFFERSSNYEPFVKNPEDRAKTVLVIEVKKGSEELIKRLKSKGIQIGSGYGDYKKNHIRISNFPSHSMEMVKKLLNNI